MSRLIIEVSDQQHQHIKTIAALQGLSIKEYALQRLFPPEESKAWGELQALLKERIEKAKKGGVSTKSFDEILAEGLNEENNEGTNL